MRKNWSVVLVLLLAGSPSLRAGDSPPSPPPWLNDLATLANDSKAVLSARLNAIDLLGDFGATPSYATWTVGALSPLLPNPVQLSATATTPASESLAPGFPPESYLIWQHTIQGLAKSGADAVATIPKIVALKGLDPYLDDAIETAVASIQRAKLRPVPPAASPPSGSPPPSSFGTLAAFCTKVAKETTNEGVLNDALAVFKESTAPVELVRCAASVARFVAGSKPAPQNLSAYLVALAELLDGRDVAMGVCAAADLGELGTKDSVFDLVQASTKPNQNPAVKAAADAAIQQILKRNQPSVPAGGPVPPNPLPSNPVPPSPMERSTP